MNFKNGASVSRVWSDGSGEVLAQFQYFSDAKTWAAIKSVDDISNGMTGMLIAVSHFDAEIFVTKGAVE